MENLQQLEYYKYLECLVLSVIRHIHKTLEQMHLVSQLQLLNHLISAIASV